MARGHNSINAFILAVVAALLIAVTGACDNTARGARQDAQQAEEQTRDERAEAAEAAREIRDDAARTADRVGQAASEAGEELAERAGAAWQTVDVKGALMADSAVDATRINVSTDYRTKTVSLDGYVSSDPERSRAEAVARARAQGYTIVNNLEVRARGQ